MFFYYDEIQKDISDIADKPVKFRGAFNMKAKPKRSRTKPREEAR